MLAYLQDTAQIVFIMLRFANKFRKSQIRKFADLNTRFADFPQMWHFADLRTFPHCKYSV
jgi:flagellar motor switch protein FliM